MWSVIRLVTKAQARINSIKQGVAGEVRIPQRPLLEF